MPKDTPGRPLYDAYRQIFAYRHPLPWGALHEHERGLWRQLEGDARTLLDPAEREATVPA